ncbi:MAG: hypothetical protein AAGB93_00970 [Planctomycetota bacterium]
MTASTLGSGLLIAAALAPGAFAQSTLSIRVDGTVLDVSGAPVAPFDGAAVGQPVSISIDVDLPGILGGAGDVLYDVVPSAVDVRVGTASDGLAAGGGEVSVRSDTTLTSLVTSLELAGGLRADVLLLDTPPVQTFLSADLLDLVGIYPASDFDVPFVSLVGFSDAIDVEVDQLVIGLGGGPSVGTSYCGPAAANSAGRSAEIVASGSSLVEQNDLTLGAFELPPNSFAFFLASRTQGSIANPGGSEGTLCLGGAIGRLVGPGEIQNSGSLGIVSVPVDLTRVPQPTGPVAAAAGETWNFQGWYRDSVGGAATSNFTDGVTVVLR